MASFRCQGGTTGREFKERDKGEAHSKADGVILFRSEGEQAAATAAAAKDNTPTFQQNLKEKTAREVLQPYLKKNMTEAVRLLEEFSPDKAREAGEQESQGGGGGAAAPEGEEGNPKKRTFLAEIKKIVNPMYCTRVKEGLVVAALIEMVRAGTKDEKPRARLGAWLKIDQANAVNEQLQDELVLDWPRGFELFISFIYELFPPATAMTPKERLDNVFQGKIKAWIKYVGLIRVAWQEPEPSAAVQGVSRPEGMLEGPAAGQNSPSTSLSTEDDRGTASRSGTSGSPQDGRSESPAAQEDPAEEEEGGEVPRDGQLLPVRPQNPAEGMLEGEEDLENVKVTDEDFDFFSVPQNDQTSPPGGPGSESPAAREDPAEEEEGGEVARDGQPLPVRPPNQFDTGTEWSAVIVRQGVTEEGLKVIVVDELQDGQHHILHPKPDTFLYLVFGLDKARWAGWPELNEVACTMFVSSDLSTTGRFTCYSLDTSRFPTGIPQGSEMAGLREHQNFIEELVHKVSELAPHLAGFFRGADMGSGNFDIFQVVKEGPASKKRPMEQTVDDINGKRFAGGGGNGIADSGRDGGVGGSTQAMHTAFLSAQPPKASQCSSEPVCGVGIELSVLRVDDPKALGGLLSSYHGWIFVSNLIEGGAAERSRRVSRGDTLVHIDGDAVGGSDSEWKKVHFASLGVSVLDGDPCAQRIAGRVGTLVRLGLRTQKGEPYEVILQREDGAAGQGPFSLQKFHVQGVSRPERKTQQWTVQQQQQNLLQQQEQILSATKALVEQRQRDLMGKQMELEAAIELERNGGGDAALKRVLASMDISLKKHETAEETKKELEARRDYLKTKELQKVRSPGGVGIRLRIHKCTQTGRTLVYVNSLAQGGAAARSKQIVPDDSLVCIDGVAIGNLDTEVRRSLQRIAGPAGTWVRLGLMRKDAKGSEITFDVDLQRCVSEQMGAKAPHRPQAPPLLPSAGAPPASQGPTGRPGGSQGALQPGRGARPNPASHPPPPRPPPTTSVLPPRGENDCQPGGHPLNFSAVEERLKELDAAVKLHEEVPGVKSSQWILSVLSSMISPNDALVLINFESVTNNPEVLRERIRQIRRDGTAVRLRLWMREGFFHDVVIQGSASTAGARHPNTNSVRPNNTNRLGFEPFRAGDGKLEDLNVERLDFDDVEMGVGSHLTSRKRVNFLTDVGSGTKLSQLSEAARTTGNKLCELGEYEGALAQYRGFLRIAKASLGNEHPEVVATMFGIGILLCEQGEYDGALAQFEEVLRIEIWVLGEGHPEVATTIYGIANVLYRKGKYEDALAQYKMAREIRVRALGWIHPQVSQVTSAMNAALLALRTSPSPSSSYLNFHETEVPFADMRLTNPSPAPSYLSAQRTEGARTAAPSPLSNPSPTFSYPGSQATGGAGNPLHWHQAISKTGDPVASIRVNILKADGVRMNSDNAETKPAVFALLLINPLPQITEAFYCTCPAAASTSPVWNEQCSLPIRDLRTTQLACTLWDANAKKDYPSNFLGEVILNLSKLVPFEGQLIKQVFDIKQGKTYKTEKPVSGRILLGLQLDSHPEPGAPNNQNAAQDAADPTPNAPSAAKSAPLRGGSDSGEFRKQAGFEAESEKQASY